MTDAVGNKLQEVLEAIDKANACDPNTEVLPDGSEISKELIYGQRMSEALALFNPDASMHLQIAARAQHIERWKSPRSDYPEGRSAYKKWRSNLGLFHAQRAAEIMQSFGFSNDDKERVKYLLQKRGLKRDAETQCLEDVICLVFLSYYLDPFIEKHSREKVIDIIQKTWKKMSAQGHENALKIPFSDKAATIVQGNL